MADKSSVMADGSIVVADKPFVMADGSFVIADKAFPYMTNNCVAL